ncbi:hypothetical protein EV356DRAFT_508025, partial [Viridothelium virens]
MQQIHQLFKLPAFLFEACAALLGQPSPDPEKVLIVYHYKLQYLFFGPMIRADNNCRGNRWGVRSVKAVCRVKGQSYCGKFEGNDETRSGLDWFI